MNLLRSLFILTATTVFLAGCAQMGSVAKQPWCSIGGAILGAGAGIGINEGINSDDSDEAEDKRPLAGALGGAAGAAIGAVLCAEAPQPVACATDTDGDGIMGDGEAGCADRCPNTPSNVQVDVEGCPKVGETLMTLEGVNFAFDSASITADSEETLEKAVQALNDASTVSVSVEGHTDSLGSDAYNQRLSEDRAGAVMDYLISRGIDQNRLESQGFGETQPVDSNETEEGRYHNRRVELKVISNK